MQFQSHNGDGDMSLTMAESKFRSIKFSDYPNAEVGELYGFFNDSVECKSNTTVYVDEDKVATQFFQFRDGSKLTVRYTFVAETDSLVKTEVVLPSENETFEFSIKGRDMRVFDSPCVKMEVTFTDNFYVVWRQWRNIENDSGKVVAKIMDTYDAAVVIARTLKGGVGIPDDASVYNVGEVLKDLSS